MNSSQFLLNIAIVVVCIIALWYGATYVVEAAARIARRLGMSDLVIGLTVVAIGTSMPEFAVTVSAAIRGAADISVGNVVGSNIFNLGFILGGVVAVKAIATSPKLVYRDGGMLIGASLLLLFFLRDRQMQRYEGIILMLILVGYIGMLIYNREASDEELPEGDFDKLDIVRFFVGLTMIALGGHYLVESASVIARSLGVSEWVIAVTIVAAGTSAPEVATSLVALARGHANISIGNLIGSDLFNLLGVLGLAATIQRPGAPMLIDPAGQTSLLLLCGMVTLVVVMMRTGWKLARWEGGLLIFINIVRWIFDFT